jgi:hypothetical protein
MRRRLFVQQKNRGTGRARQMQNTLENPWPSLRRVPGLIDMVDEVAQFTRGIPDRFGMSSTATHRRPPIQTREPAYAMRRGIT